MFCDICAGEVIEMQPLNKLAKLTCRAGHTYSKLKRDGDAYFKTQTDVKKENHEIKRAKPSMSKLWQEIRGGS